MVLLRFMYKINVPFEDRMSMKEFDEYETRITARRIS